MLLSTVQRFTQWFTAAPTAPDVADLRIKRADAQNLLQQLQHDLEQSEDDLDVLEARYHDLLRNGRQRQAEMVFQQIADIEQGMILKSNRAKEFAEIAQLLQWDEVQQATDFVHRAYSADLQQTKNRIAEQLAQQSVRRNQLYDLAHMVKDSEADQARMADASHDALRSRLAQGSHARSIGQTGVSMAPMPPQRAPLGHQAAATVQPDDAPSIAPGFDNSFSMPSSAAPPAVDQEGTWCAPPKPPTR